MKITRNKLLIQGKNENYEFDMVIKFRELELMDMNDYDRTRTLFRYYKPILIKLEKEKKISPVDLHELGDIIEEWVENKLYAGEKAPQEEYVFNLIKFLRANKIKLNGKTIIADDIVEGTINKDAITYPDADIKKVNKIETDLTRARSQGVEKFPIIVSNVTRILQKTKDLANNKSTTRINFTDIISNEILALMKNTPQYSLKDREEIYAFWEKTHKSHKSLVTKGKAMINSWGTKEGPKERTKEFPEELMKRFEKTFSLVKENNYVVLVHGVDVIDTDIEEQAEQIFSAFYNRKNSANPHTVSLTSEGTKNQKYDILTALYIDTVLGGAFYDGHKEEIAKLKTALADYEGIFVGDLEKHKKGFEKFVRGLKNADSLVGVVSLEEAEKISEAGGKILDKKELTKTYIPSMILSPEYLNEHYPTMNSLIYINLHKGLEGIQNIYKKLIQDTVNLLTVGDITTGGAIRGKSVSGPQFKNQTRPPTYSESWASKETEYRTTSPTIAKKLYEFIREIKEYLIDPIETPKVSLGIHFDFKETVAYDTLVMLTAQGIAGVKRPRHPTKTKKQKETEKTRLRNEKQVNVNLATRAMLQNKFSSDTGGSAILSQTSVIAIKTFLEELNKPFDFTELQVKAVDLISAMKKTMTTRVSGFDRKIRNEISDNIESEIHSFINAVAIKLNRKKDPPFNRTNIPLMEIDRLQDIHSFQILKDFIVKNVDSLKANRDNLDAIVQLINTVQTSDILSMKLLSAHDGLRIIKGLPIHYGLKSLYSFEGVSSMIDELSLNHGIDISAMDIVKAVETVDSFENIGMDIGISEENVYVIKANFR